MEIWNYEGTCRWRLCLYDFVALLVCYALLDVLANSSCFFLEVGS